MDNDLYEEQQVPSGFLTSISFNVSTQADTEKISILAINAVGEVTDPKLGLPNPTSECSTCGAKDLKCCEGHFGAIKFPFTILNPYFLSEVAKILNKICPGCKSIRQEQCFKGGNSVSSHHRPKGCKYCVGNSIEWYPKVKFKVSSNELFRRSAIIVEVNEKLPKKFQNKSFRGLPADYWDFIPKDEQEEESCMKPNRRVLSHAQVRYLLNDVDPWFIKQYVSRPESLFLNCFPVTPNCHRVTEVTHAFSNGQRLIFDERTRAYKKLVDFRGIANDLGSRVLDCMKISKLSSEKSSSNGFAPAQQKKITDPSSSSGLRWIKDVVLGKRSDHCFRMVVVGDPRIKLSEIGIPCHVAERLQVSERLNKWNFDKLSDSCRLCFIEKGEIFVRRKSSLVRVRRIAELQLGDTIYRPLNDGDIVLINRPPSIHQHSLLALSVRVLPITSALSLNPLCCSPLRGDFDGDCLHGYVPQSIEARVELSELVGLDKQLTNWQNGRNLLSLSQDSLTAAHLVMEEGVLLNRFQMQQLQMFCPHQLLMPAVFKAPSINGFAWTGKQLFSMLLPPGFNYVFPSNGVCISNGELLSSEGSFWLRDNNNNLFQSLDKHCQGNVLDFLYAAQGVFCEWLSMRGLSVSLSDLYLSPDSFSRKNMMDEIFCGLQEAEQTCNFKQLMVDSCRDFLVGGVEENQNPVGLDVVRMFDEKQKSAALSQASFDAFKKVFRDIQILVYKYASKDNSLLAMFKAGSKGNLLKLVQHSMCLGLQHSLVPLSFSIPHQLSCAAWNNKKAGLVKKADDTPESAGSYIPCGVVENSFLVGLNPLECFVHSVTSRDSSFSDNADLPGTLNRRLMFFMRDLFTAYDGTVRNAYGNQIIQFNYNNINKDSSTPNSGTHDLFGEGVNACDGIGGQPVGSLSACAISEAAYSALDQPISLLETSPLLNLKHVLECGTRKRNQTVSLFLSEKLRRRMHGFEYGALEVKNHLERLIFSDIVSTVMIIFSPQTCSKMHFSPWVCHFHICKEIAKRRGLKVHSIINSLHVRCNSARTESKINLPNLQITSKECSVTNKQKEYNDTFCITVTIAENSKNFSLQWDTVRDLLIPFLLGTVIKGFPEIKKVDILWNDRPKVSRCHDGSSGELYLRVATSGVSGKTKIWNLLMNDCLPIMDMIDWSRSHPDNIHDFCLAYGIDAGWKYFLSSLESAISDIGKSTLPEHLLLVANTLSATGEFVGLNAKGISQQREHSSVSSPFMQACFSSPGACFIKAAKAGVVDDLKGNLDALAWGKIPAMGTGGQFDIIYSGKGLELAKPVDIYNLLGSQIISDKQNVKVEPLIAHNSVSDKCGAQFVYKKLESISKSLRSVLTTYDIQKMSHMLKVILYKYPINHSLNETDKSFLRFALCFHPRREEKIGTGAQDIKVGCNPEYQNTRCFVLVRMDGTVEDFSYHKCVLGALELIDPQRAKSYKSSRLLQHSTV